MDGILNCFGGVSRDQVHTFYVAHCSIHTILVTTPNMTGTARIDHQKDKNDTGTFWMKLREIGFIHVFDSAITR